MPTRLNSLVKTSYEIAVEKGWHVDERSLAALTLLMQSEVAEALEEYRSNRRVTEVYSEGDDHKICGIPVEIADLVIRVADYCGRYGVDLEAWTKGAPPPIGDSIDFEEWLARINYALSQAWKDDPSQVGLWLGIAVNNAFAMSKAFGIDLWAVIDEKTTFNRTRPYRHGGKKI
jgi:NTP pyrophosphatase (non-canonical NTP hydrolase)